MWNFFCTAEQQSAVLKRAACTVYYQCGVNTQHARSAKRTCEQVPGNWEESGKVRRGGGCACSG